MNRLRRLVGVCALTLLVLCAAVPAQAGGTKSLSFTATNCKEAASFFFLDPAVVRPFVPERFEVGLVTDTPALAELAVVTTQCEELTTRGKSAPSFFSEVGVYIDNVDSSPGNWHYYGLWHASNHRELSKSLGRLGVTAPLVKDVSFSSTTGVIDAAASVPWSKASYEVKVVAPTRPALFGIRPSVWWYSDGGGNYVRAIYSAEETGVMAGTGTLETTADTALGAMLGGASRQADQSILVDYSTFEASVSRVKL